MKYTIPIEIKESLDLWVSHGIQPGSFTSLVLQNRFEAVTQAHRSLTADNLRDIFYYIYNELPSECWGSREKFKDWKMKFD